MSSLPSDAPSPSLNNGALQLPSNYQRGSSRAVASRRPADLHASQAPYYDFAKHLQSFAGLACVIDIGCSDARLLTERFDESLLAVIGDRSTLARAASYVPKRRLFLQNFSQLLSLPEALLQRSVVICSDLLHRMEDPRPLVESLCRIAQIAPFVIVGMPDRARCDGPLHKGPPTTAGSVRHWRLEEARALFVENGASVPFCGHLGPQGLASPRNQQMLLLGSHCLNEPAPAKTVVALVSCYNDIDILRHCYAHLKQQGVAVAFIDNWSQDGTWQQVQQWRQQEPQHCVHAEQFPSHGPSDNFELSAILARKTELAQQLEFDWILHHDSDEFREGPNPDLTMAETLSRLDALGYNAIDHTVIDFRPTDASFTGHQNPDGHFSHFEFGDRIDLFMQIRAWKRQPAPVNLMPLGGHVAFFPSMRVYPLKFLLRHYSIRSPAHAEKKFFQHRLPRVEKERRERGWHHHLESEVQERAQHKFLWEPKDLLPYAPGVFAHEYLLQRLAGLGIHDTHRRQAIELYTGPSR